MDYHLCVAGLRRAWGVGGGGTMLTVDECRVAGGGRAPARQAVWRRNMQVCWQRECVSIAYM
jgi:hypothetical protein